MMKQVRRKKKAGRFEKRAIFIFDQWQVCP
jgi:hypothetical protein